MSLARLMNQPLTVQAQGSTLNSYGDQVLGPVGAPVAAFGFLEQVTSVEYLANRDTTVTSWKAFLPAVAAIGAKSYITFGSQRFQIDGEPHHVYNPRTRMVSHIECKLVVVDG